MNTDRKVALITGASSGIGEDLARLFAKDGHDVVLVARSEAKLRALADALAKEHGVDARVMAADLAQPEAAAELVRRLEEQGIAVDVLVNNAGLGSYGGFAEADLGGLMQMIQVNVVALTQLTRLLVPGMRTRGHGRILNLASTAAFQPGPLMAVYYATKAFVLSLSEALGNELEGSGVTVTALCPGPTESGFQAAARMEGVKLVASGLMSSRKVAEIGFRGLMKGQRVVVPGFKNKMLVQSVRFVPRKTVTKIVRNMQERAA